MTVRISSIALAGVAVVTIVATGIAIGVFAANPPIPPSLDSTALLTDSPVTTREFTDRRAVSVEVHPSTDIPISVGTSGRLTAWSCQLGAVLESGQSFVSVDGKPLLALATTTPLWRDLRIGATGADVSALQHELLRLGQSVSQDGVLGKGTIAGLNALLLGVGASAVQGGTVIAGAIVWLPTLTATVKSCDASIGETVNVGDQLASTAGTASASIVDLPSDLIAGARTLTVDGQAVAIADDGTVSDAAALQNTAAYRSAAEDGTPAAVIVAGALELVEPTQVSVIPPSSVFGAEGNRCVASNGKSYRISVVGSELGQTLVTFDSESTAPSKVELHPDSSSTACG